MKRYKSKNYFDSPIKAARRLSYLNVGRYGKYDNFYMEGLPKSNYSRSRCPTTSLRPPPMMAESYADIQMYEVAEHTKLVSYYQDTKDNEMGSHGWLFGTLITLMDYNVSCTWWTVLWWSTRR